MSLGTTLKELRLEKSESLQTVATAVEVSKSHIWELERGSTTNPSLKLIKNLADHFGQSVEYLTGDDDKSTAQMSFARKVDGLNLSETDLDALYAAAKILSLKQ